MDYWEYQAERQARRAANKAAWAANRHRRERLMAFRRDTERRRRKQWLPRGGSMVWSRVADWAEARGVRDVAKAARDEHMPFWQPGDNIPLRVVKAILIACMKARGDKLLRKLAQESRLP